MSFCIFVEILLYFIAGIDSTIIYKTTNEKIEQLTKFVAYAFYLSIIILVIPPFFYTIISYYFLGSGRDSFFLFFPAWFVLQKQKKKKKLNSINFFACIKKRFPFDWKTLFGYFFAWLTQCVGIAATVTACISFFNCVFASCWLFMVIIEDITNDMAAFNNSIETLNDGHRADLMDHFCKIIQLYTNAKQ